MAAERLAICLAFLAAACSGDGEAARCHEDRDCPRDQFCDTGKSQCFTPEVRPRADASVAARDGGTGSSADSGTAHRDSGLPGSDSGAPSGDSGSPNGDATAALDADPGDSSPGDASPADTGAMMSPMDAGAGCSGICGDIDNSGGVDQVDVTALDMIVNQGAMATTCVMVQGDLREDMRLSKADLILLQVAIARRVSRPLTQLCEPCNRPCGDSDGDGAVTQQDARHLEGEILRNRINTGCQFWLSDTTGDGRLDTDDSLGIIDFVTGIGPLRCAP
jgi:hypothetical protein